MYIWSWVERRVVSEWVREKKEFFTWIKKRKTETKKSWHMLENEKNFITSFNRIIIKLWCSLSLSLQFSTLYFFSTTQIFVCLLFFAIEIEEENEVKRERRETSSVKNVFLIGEINFEKIFNTFENDTHSREKRKTLLRWMVEMRRVEIQLKITLATDDN